jgi:hypothetical protein
VGDTINNKERSKVILTAILCMGLTCGVILISDQRRILSVFLLWDWSLNSVVSTPYLQSKKDSLSDLDLKPVQHQQLI